MIEETNSETAHTLSSIQEYMQSNSEVPNNDVDEKDNNENIIDGINKQINLQLLQAKPLIVIPIKLDNKSISSLIDSGATNSLIRISEVENYSDLINTNETNTIIGIADHTIQTLGKIEIKVNLYGIDIITKMDVVKDEDMRFPAILGVDFLTKQRIKIDLAKRRIIKANEDGSTVNIYLDNENNTLAVVNENIPVYTSKTIIIKANESISVPVKFCIPGNEVNTEMTNLYFENQTNNKHENIESLEGVISSDKSNKFVIICAVGSTKPKDTIKENTIVGRVSTIIPIQKKEDTNDKNEETNDWTETRLLSEIRLGNDLNNYERKEVYKMLLRVRHALSKHDSDIGTAKVIPHQIELTNNTPIWQKPRNFADPINKEIEKQCSELLTEDIIEHSSSNWSSPIVPVRKQDGTLRMCIDYRKLNTVTKIENFPMPSLSNCIYRAHNVKYFTKIDLTRGYYQVPIADDSRQYTAFSSMKNHYQFKRLSFGLKNSGIAFQRIMQQILAPYLNSNIIIYIDDILIMSETFEEHLNMVSKILTTLSNYGIKIKVKKCTFFKSEVSFLGHIINRQGIKKSPEFIEKVKNYPKPKTITELRQFLGLVNFQRKFIQNCSLITKSLSSITGQPKRKIINWTEEQTNSFNLIKLEIEKEVALSYPDYSESANPLQLYVDASGTGAGACLMQKQNNINKVIGYTSMCFNTAQTRYSTTERELTAIRWGINSFKSFVYGVYFLLYTDHKPLIYLHNMSINNSRLMRTITELSEYQFDIKYCPGLENSAADFLSRLNTNNNNTNEQNIGDFKQLPRGLKVISIVEGGGNSLFHSVIICLNELREEQDNNNYPSDHSELRKTLVDEIIKNHKKYNLNLDRNRMKEYKLMYNDGQLPCTEILLAICFLYNLHIFVHHGMKFPVIYSTKDTNEDTKTIHLQCLSQIHYNPVYARNSNDTFKDIIKDKNINTFTKVETKPTNDNNDINNDEYLDDLPSLYSYNDISCIHETDKIANTTISYKDESFCCLLDTGAQVSLIRESSWNRIQQLDNNTEIFECSDGITGLGDNKVKLIGCTKLQFSLSGEICKPLMFGIVKDDILPCCILLGINFLEDNKFIMDFYQQCITHSGSKMSHNIVLISNIISNRRQFNISGYLGNIFVNDTDSDSESSHNEIQLTPKFLISSEELITMQEDNHAIKVLKRMIKNNIPTNSWKYKSIQQFKRINKSLKIVDNILVKCSTHKSPVVVSFPFLVEIVNKVHQKLAHIGRHKLVNAVSEWFYHPALDKVAGDVCLSCAHCQIYKTNNQPIFPPTLKISTNNPFDLVAVDLLQFCKSSRNNVAALVCVDHFSKWLSIVPIYDKKATTVANALRYKILPFLPKIPNRILSDNGPEFRSNEFKALLNEFNITEVKSTPLKPSSNGAVERINRTVIEFLKGFKHKQGDWEQNIHRAVITYNNTWHSQINMTPAQCILNEAHSTQNQSAVDQDTLSTWKEGHPNFSSFSLNQLVIRKMNRIGNQLTDKLKQRYEGPYIITKIQSNGVTYEITDINNKEKIYKTHHKYLRIWHEIPKYLQKYISNTDTPTTNNIESSSEDNIQYIGNISESSDDFSDTDSSTSDTSNSDSEDSDQSGSTDSSSDTDLAGHKLEHNDTKGIEQHHEVPTKNTRSVATQIQLPEIQTDYNMFHSTPVIQRGDNTRMTFSECSNKLDKTLIDVIELSSSLKFMLYDRTHKIDNMVRENESDNTDSIVLNDRNRNVVAGNKNVHDQTYKISEDRDLSLGRQVNNANTGSTFSDLSPNIPDRSTHQTVVSELRDLVAHAKEAIVSMLSSESDSSTEVHSDILSELPDRLTPLRPLRSNYRVREYPNVQPKTLEFVLNKKKRYD